MPESKPAIRARSCQDTLAYLDVYRAGSRAEIERRLDPRTLETIRTALPGGWIPVEVDAELGREVLSLFGRDEALRFWTRYITHHLDSPLLAGPVRTAVSLLGATPASLVKWMPKVNRLIYRDLFEIHIGRLEPRRVELRYDVTSEVVLREPFYLVVIEATIRAFFVFTDVTGHVKATRDLNSRSFDVVATWA